MAKTVTVEIDLETNEASVDLNGWQGKGCAAVTAAFSEMGNVKKDIKKPEFKQQVCKVVQK